MLEEFFKDWKFRCLLINIRDIWWKIFIIIQKSKFLSKTLYGQYLVPLCYPILCTLSHRQVLWLPKSLSKKFPISLSFNNMYNISALELVELLYSPWFKAHLFRLHIVFNHIPFEISDNPNSWNSCSTDSIYAISHIRNKKVPRAWLITLIGIIKSMLKRFLKL